MTIHDRQYLHALAALGLADLRAAALGRDIARVDEALAFIDPASLPLTYDPVPDIA